MTARHGLSIPTQPRGRTHPLCLAYGARACDLSIPTCSLRTDPRADALPDLMISLARAKAKLGSCARLPIQNSTMSFDLEDCRHGLGLDARTRRAIKRS